MEQDNNDIRDDEDSENNTKYDVEYNSTTKEDIIRALQNEAGHIGLAQEALLEHRFDMKQWWRYGTTIRLHQCEMQLEQILHRVRKGLSQDQAIIQRATNEIGFINIGAFIFDGSANDIRGHHNEMYKFLAKMNWCADFQAEIYAIKIDAGFTEIWDQVGREQMDAFFFLPRPLDDINTPRHVVMMHSVLGTFAAIRMKRDGVDAKTAYDNVMASKGFDARHFFG